MVEHAHDVGAVDLGDRVRLVAKPRQPLRVLRKFRVQQFHGHFDFEGLVFCHPESPHPALAERAHEPKVGRNLFSRRRHTYRTLQRDGPIGEKA